MNGYCDYFKCDTDDYETIQRGEAETGELCLCDCQDCEWYSEVSR